MSEPFRLHGDNPIHSAMLEIISAMSALNMPPEPLAKPEGEYLSETDVWAKHAMEHLNAACEHLRVIEAKKT